MTIKTYRYVLVDVDGKPWWPTKDQISQILSEMDRYGPNRGWVLGRALSRARRDKL